MNQSVRILTLAVLASLVACTPSWAQDAVPARNDPLHITKLENEYVRVFNVYIPPGKSTTFHEHAFDFSVVFVEGSKLKNEMMGGTTAEVVVNTGTVAYGGFAAKPVVQRITNLSDNANWQVAFEILVPSAGKFQTSARDAAYKVELDNERLRAWRLILQPGQSVPAITQTAPGLRIALSDGKIVQQVGGSDQEISIKRGEFLWQPARSSRSLRNAGNVPVEFVEYELK